MKRNPVSERPVAVPLSMVAIDRFARNLASGEQLLTFVTDAKRLVHQVSAGGKLRTPAARQLAEKFSRKFPGVVKLSGPARFSAWAETLRTENVEELAVPIKQHALKLASKPGLKVGSWAHHSAVVSLSNSRIKNRFFGDSGQSRTATVGFLIFLFLVALAVLILYLLFAE